MRCFSPNRRKVYAAMSDPHDGAIGVVREYIEAVTTALNRLDPAEVSAVIEELWSAYQADRQIFILGNGGSASTSSHMATDLAKGTRGYRGDAPVRPVRALSLTDNTALISAWANDVGFEHVFLGQLQTHLRLGDAIVALSASGNSPNILAAIHFAREAGARTIGLTGFGGGALNGLVDRGIVVDSRDYGVVEDVHLQIGHMIAHCFRQRIAAGGGPGRIVP
jgi:D-sedoheptulose 7-phosphate isomerase